MRAHYLVSAVFLAAILSAQLIAEQADQSTPAGAASVQAKSMNHGQASAAVLSDEGQRAFEQNCSRCHSAPEGFSPRISGTIVRHMRVRASLSKREEQELRRFFNP